MHTNNIKKGLLIAIALMSETSSILFDFQGDKALISRLAVGYLTLNSRCLNEQRNPINSISKYVPSHFYIEHGEVLCVFIGMHVMCEAA